MRRFPLKSVLLTLLWFSLALGGTAALQAYESQSGANSSRADWPGGTDLPFGKAGTLVVFIHPKCPCSRATERQLERLLSSATTGLSLDVVVLNPELRWSDSQIVNSLARLPNATIKMDSNGNETRRFGAATSGQVLYFDPSGRVRFAGGITESRGHEGDCDALTALERAIAGNIGERNNTEFIQTPVFGCALMHGDKEKSLCRN